MHKPMLATEADLSSIVYPKYASPKIDGIRALVQSGQATSRSLKPLPNRHIQTFFRLLPENLDGELVVGPITDKNVMQATTSGVMSIEGTPNFTYMVFDYYHPTWTYEHRTQVARDVVGAIRLPWIQFHEDYKVDSLEHLEHLESVFLDEGYEGMILRNPGSLYKEGRATLKSQDMLKVKRFSDSEAEILEFVELMHNNNEAQQNELGRTFRSSDRAGLEGGNKLGALIVKDIKNGWEFSIGTGFNEAQRVSMWKDRTNLKDKLVKYKYFPHGMLNVPRHPVFLGFRDKSDL